MAKIKERPFSGDYSRDLFNERRRYVASLLQQGKTLIDADVNDGTQILASAIQRMIAAAFPPQAAGDSFKIQASPTSTSNNFHILCRQSSGNRANSLAPHTYGRYFVGGVCAILSDSDAYEGREFLEDTGNDFIFGELHHRSTALATSILTDENARFVAGELIGMSLIPNVADGTAFPIIANTETTITVTGDLLGVSALGDFYCVKPSTPGTLASVNISSVANNGGHARITAAAAHGRLTGDTVTISGSTDGDYDGDWTINVVSDVEFDIDADYTQPSTGAFVVTNPGRRDLIYLDVVLGEADSDEDSELLHPIAAGYESARRVVVRQQIIVRENTTLGDLDNAAYLAPGLPWVSDPTALEGYYQDRDGDGQFHYCVKLAVLSRPESDGDILAAYIEDVRDPWFGSSRETVEARQGYASLKDRIEKADGETDQRYDAYATEMRTSVSKASHGNVVQVIASKVYVGESAAEIGEVARLYKIRDGRAYIPAFADYPSLVSMIEDYSPLDQNDTVIFHTLGSLDLSGGSITITLSGISADPTALEIVTDLNAKFAAYSVGGGEYVSDYITAYLVQDSGGTGGYVALRCTENGPGIAFGISQFSTALSHGLFATAQLAQFSDGANGLLVTGDRQPNIIGISTSLSSRTWPGTAGSGPSVNKYADQPYIAFDAILDGEYIIRFGVGSLFERNTRDGYIRRGLFDTSESLDRRLDTEHYFDGQHRDAFLKSSMVDWGTGTGQISAASVPIAAITGLAATAVQSALSEIQSSVSSLQTSIPLTYVAKAGDTMAGVLSMGTYRITNLGTPTQAADAATKAYVDSAAAGFHILDIRPDETIACVSTADIADLTGLRPGDTIDTHVLVDQEIFLLKDQAVASENGLWRIRTGDTPIRPDYWNSTLAPSAALGAFVFSRGEPGAENEATGWVMNYSLTDVIDVSDQYWTLFSSAAAVSPGVALGQAGSVFNVKYAAPITVDGSNQLALSLNATSLEESGGSLRIAAAMAGDGLTGGGGSRFDIELDTSNSGLELTTTGGAGKLKLAAPGDGLERVSGVEGKIRVKLNATNPCLTRDANGLSVKLNGTSLEATSAGLRLNTVTAGGGLQGGGASALAVLLDPGIAGLAITASGLKLKSDIAGNGIVYTSGVLSLKLNASSPGLALDGSGLTIKLDGTSLELTANGIKLRAATTALSNFTGTISDTQHGNLGRRTGGIAHHTDATTTEAGFLSAADKVIVNKVMTSDSANPLPHYHAEAKVVFDSTSGHDHSGTTAGKKISASGLNNDAVITDKVLDKNITRRKIPSYFNMIRNSSGEFGATPSGATSYFGWETAGMGVLLRAYSDTASVHDGGGPMFGIGGLLLDAQYHYDQSELIPCGANIPIRISGDVNFLESGTTLDTRFRLEVRCYDSGGSVLNGGASIIYTNSVQDISEVVGETRAVQWQHLEGSGTTVASTAYVRVLRVFVNNTYTGVPASRTVDCRLRSLMLHHDHEGYAVPYQPRPQSTVAIKCVDSASQALVNITNTYLSFADAPDYDYGGLDPSANITFYVPDTGIYAISAQADIVVSPAGGSLFNGSFYLVFGGSPEKQGASVDLTADTVYNYQAYTEVHLTAGQAIQAYIGTILALNAVVDNKRITIRKVA